MHWLIPVLLTGLVAASARAEDGWEQVGEVKGPGAHRLFRRQLPDARVAAFRLEGLVEVPIASVLEAERAGPKADAKHAEDPRSHLVRQAGEVSIIYRYIPLPMLADRDLVLRQKHSLDPSTGIHRIVWHTIEGEGPPPPEGVVRIQRSEGMWEFTPQGDSRTRLVLESLTDVGGSLPAWLVNSFYPRELRGQWDGLIARIRDSGPAPP